MDIVITLPRILIYKIKKGSKKVEIRKSFPKEFDFEEDCVFVVEKGTKNVVMSFDVIKVSTADNPALAWDYCGSQMGIPYEWLREYATPGKELYIWHIGDVHEFAKPFPLEETFFIKRAPQSYCYVRRYL